MTDRALSQDAMFASLRDIRLPEAAAGGWASDLAMAVGLACIAALLVVAAAHLVSQKRATPAGQTPRQELDRARHLPEAEKRIALLRILRTHAPDRYRALTQDLYSPGGAPDTPTLEAEAAAHV